MITQKSFDLGDFTSTLSLHDDAGELLSNLPDRHLFICDENIWKLFPDILPQFTELLAPLPVISSLQDIKTLSRGGSAIVVLPGGEAAKSLANIELILQTAFALSFARDSGFIGIGGGAVTDATAFASSLFMRGNNCILIPSTLLAMVDASFGGKTGINYIGLKNMVGTFYPAGEVRVFPGLLKSLSGKEYLSGMAEVIKSGMLDDPELFTILEERKDEVLSREATVLSAIIWKSLMVKGRVVLADLRESGVRATLNLGHTFGHALESVSGLGSWSHGEAVAWGILRALELGVRLGHTRPEYRDRAEKLLRDYNYRLDSSSCDPHELLNAMKQDKKKKAGVVRFVLQEDLCRTFQKQIDDDEVLAVLN